VDAEHGLVGAPDVSPVSFFGRRGQAEPVDHRGLVE
jgi:hypothetical protein